MLIYSNIYIYIYIYNIFIYIYVFNEIPLFTNYNSNSNHLINKV